MEKVVGLVVTPGQETRFANPRAARGRWDADAERDGREPGAVAAGRVPISGARYVEALLDGLIASDELRNPLSVPALAFERMDVVVRHAEQPPPQRSSIPTRK